MVVVLATLLLRGNLATVARPRRTVGLVVGPPPPPPPLDTRFFLLRGEDRGDKLVEEERVKDGAGAKMEGAAADAVSEDCGDGNDEDDIISTS